MNCEIKLFLFRWVFDKNFLKFLFKFLKSWLVIYIYEKCLYKAKLFHLLKKGEGEEGRKQKFVS